MMLNQISLPSRASCICSVAVSLFSQLLSNHMLTGINRSWTNRSGSICAESGIACAMGFGGDRFKQSVGSRQKQLRLTVAVGPDSTGQAWVSTPKWISMPLLFFNLGLTFVIEWASSS
jgi:hypothetical protein